jgi:hypothetical protein
LDGKCGELVAGIESLEDSDDASNAVWLS